MAFEVPAVTLGWQKGGGNSRRCGDRTWQVNRDSRGTPEAANHEQVLLALVPWGEWSGEGRKGGGGGGGEGGVIHGVLAILPMLSSSECGAESMGTKQLAVAEDETGQGSSLVNLAWRRELMRCVPWLQVWKHLTEEG